MRLIPVKQAESVLKRLGKQGAAIRITLLTRKKDRSLIVERSQDMLIVIEQGYQNSTRHFSFETNEGKSAIRNAFKREFPRSHQVYISEDIKCE